MPRETLTMRELADEARALDDLVWADDGEWTDEHEALAQELAGRLAAKGDGYGDYLQEIATRADALKAEEQRLAAARKRLEAHAARLKRHAAFALRAMGRDRVEGERWTLRVQANPPRVEFCDGFAVEFLAKHLVRRREVVEADKVQIKEALKRGEDVPGARLVTDITLRVR